MMLLGCAGSGKENEKWHFKIMLTTAGKYAEDAAEFVGEMMLNNNLQMLTEVDG